MLQARTTARCSPDKQADSRRGQTTRAVPLAANSTKAQPAPASCWDTAEHKQRFLPPSLRMQVHVSVCVWERRKETSSSVVCALLPFREGLGSWLRLFFTTEAGQPLLSCPALLQGQEAALAEPQPAPLVSTVEFQSSGGFLSNPRSQGDGTSQIRLAVAQIS